MFEEIVTNDEEKFNDLERKIFKFVCVFGCMIIKLILECYDKKLMKARDKKKYRHKGQRKNTIKTIMGEVEYTRALYEMEENGIKKYVYLLDEKFKINTIGKVSENLVEKIVEIVPETESYRKSEDVLETVSNVALSFEAIRTVIIKVGDKITNKEKEERKLLDKGKLVKGLKEITALFEEADGIWINLQGKDRQEQLDRNKKEYEKKGKKFNPNMKVKTELKLHVMYEGWKKGDPRHSLVNKEYMAGIMKPKEIKKLRDARVYQKYNEEKIKLRVVNGDGARWTKGITSKDGIYQKDQFHIMQEIVRDVPKEYRNIIEELIETKQYDKIQPAIEGLKYELGGECTVLKKLKKLQSYLSKDLARYTDIVEIPEAPKGIEYRSMGTQESQIVSKLKNRFSSGRKAFGKHGANSLAKVCVLSEKFKLEELESEIPIDTSVEEWIKEIEENVKANKKMHRADKVLTEENNVIHNVLTESRFMKEIMKMKSFSEMRYS